MPGRLVHVQPERERRPDIKYDQFPAPNDNSYGVNAVGWGTKGHTFGNLVGSDHAGFRWSTRTAWSKLDFNIDYITRQGRRRPSGYASLGPFGGDGKVNVGTLTPADITYDTSLARNLNNTGYFAGGVADSRRLTRHVGATCWSIRRRRSTRRTATC